MPDGARRTVLMEATTLEKLWPGVDVETVLARAERFDQRGCRPAAAHAERGHLGAGSGRVDKIDYSSPEYVGLAAPRTSEPGRSGLRAGQTSTRSTPASPPPACGTIEPGTELATRFGLWTPSADHGAQRGAGELDRSPTSWACCRHVEHDPVEADPEDLLHPGGHGIGVPVDHARDELGAEVRIAQPTGPSVGKTWAAAMAMTTSSASTASAAITRVPSQLVRTASCGSADGRPGGRATPRACAAARPGC